MTDPLFIIVDLFCGFGGTTTGFVDAEIDGNKIAEIIACVNHDPKAIKSHWLNHPEVKHFEEDIRTLDLTELTKIVKTARKQYPHAKLILWASLECTNFSKAKGGQVAMIALPAGKLTEAAIDKKYKKTVPDDINNTILEDEAINVIVQAIRFLENLK